MRKIATKPVAMFIKKEEDESSNMNDPFAFSPPNEFKLKLYARMQLLEPEPEPEPEQKIKSNVWVKKGN